VIFRFGTYELDSGRYELRRADEALSLEPKVLDLLLYLVRERDRLVTKQDLLEQVWPGVHVTESALTRAVSLARAALGDSAQEQRVIETVSGRGYRWTAPVEVVEPGQRVPRPRARRRTVALAAAGSALALALLLVGAWPRPLGWALAITGSARPPEAPPVPSEPSVVVLPFRDLGPESGHAHLAEGIGEDLTSALIRLPTLFVIARSSAASYAGRDVPLETIGRELGVRYVVEGSVRASADRLVVTSRLVEARSGFHVWGDRFETPRGDGLAVQARLAEQIVAALGTRLEEAELERLRRRPTADFGAYELYIQAREDFFSYTQKGHARARDLLERALARDPEYARALLTRGALETAAYALGWDPRPERLEQAREWIGRGLDRDPFDPLGHATLSMIHLLEGRSLEALAAAQRAVELGPSSDVCTGVEAAALFENGRPLEALRALDRALRLNPRHPEVYWLAAGMIQAEGGRRELAAELYERVRQANPDLVAPRLALMLHHYEDGDLDAVRELAREVQGINPGLSAELALRIYPFGGRRTDLVAAFRAAGLP
jgi:TolB-like protein/DNA-binding winged helix-turn-helix (wHTH) protein/Tfp pilus assembly protein PilF